MRVCPWGPVSLLPLGPGVPPAPGAQCPSCPWAGVLPAPGGWCPAHRSGWCRGSVPAGVQLGLAEVPFSLSCQKLCGFCPFLLTSWCSCLLITPLQARLRFPIDYPYSPPAFRFLTKMWHPNIYEVGPLGQRGGSWTVSGHVCLYCDGTGCKCQPLALDTRCLWR